MTPVVVRAVVGDDGDGGSGVWGDGGWGWLETGVRAVGGADIWEGTGWRRNLVVQA